MNQRQDGRQSLRSNQCFQATATTSVKTWIRKDERNELQRFFDTTDISQWNNVIGIINPADIGSKTITCDELKIIEWLTGPAWLRKPGNE